MAWNISIENCGQTAVDEDMVTILSAYKKSPSPYPTVSSSIPHDSPFSHNTARLAYYSALWHFKIIQGQTFLCHLKANMRLPISDQ